MKAMNSNKDDDTASFHHRFYEIIQEGMVEQNTLMDLD